MTYDPTTKFGSKNALLIGGESDVAETLEQCLSQHHFECTQATNSSEGKRLVRSGNPWSLALIASDLPDGEGLELIRQFSKANPAAPVYALISPGNVLDAFHALKAGAKDCIIKYADPERLSRQVRIAVSYPGGFNQAGKKTCFDDGLAQALSTIHWKTPAMLRALTASIRAAADRQVVVIRGESGTGKGAFANWILRKTNADPEGISLLDVSKTSAEEAETLLFGNQLRKKPKFPSSGFMGDETARWKILRGAECLSHAARQAVAASMSRVAASDPSDRHCKFIICISTDGHKNENPAGPFESLPSHQILLPPLRECTADFDGIIDCVLARICVSRRIGFISTTPSATGIMKSHSWPGNLAELHSVLEHAATRTKDGIIGKEDLPPLERQLHAFKSRIALGISTVQNVQKAALISALESCNGNRRLAASKMGISLRSIYNMIKRYELNSPPGAS